MTDPYYQDDHVTIYHGDCLEMDANLGADMVFTSPPYNLGTTTGGGMHQGSMGATGGLAGGYEGYTDDLSPDAYAQWQWQVLNLCWNTLNDAGAIFYNHKQRVQNGRCTLPTGYAPDPLQLRQVITWDKGTGLNFSQSFFLPKSEWIIVWAKEGWRLASRGSAEFGDVWRIPPEQDIRHPAPFPLALPSRAIGATGAQLIVDPFMGSGTTLRAAKDLGRKAVGYEISERYCEIAAERCAQEVLDFGDTP